MPRDLALGNGRMLVTFDDAYTLRDFYYPHVGKENHTIGHPCRTGIWADGRFSWFSDAGWIRNIRYRPDCLTSEVTLEHPGMEIRIHARDTVHPEHTILLRFFEVTNLAQRKREMRMLFHQDFHISESEIGDTAGYEPVNRFVVHYKGHRYFLVNGRTGSGEGIFQYATGVKESDAREGTWRDAEDGWLGMNPMSQGSVDSAVSFREVIEGGERAHFEYWIAAAKDYWEAKDLNAIVLAQAASASARPASEASARAQSLLEESETLWRGWVNRSHQLLAELPGQVQELYRRSLLVIRTQIDHGGAIIAANDGDSLLFNRDTYSYMWPRDGALVAHTLDQAGYADLTETFFRFCSRLMPKPSYYPDGYLLHKYNPDGSVGSSWHPWVRDGLPSLAVQEDETALVLWAFWHHFDRWKSRSASLELVRELSPSLVVPASRFLLIYRDEPEGRVRFHCDYGHSPTGLPLPSYDLWEERYGIHAFTVVATCAGLDACGKFLRLIAEQGWARDHDWSRNAALDVRDTIDPSFCQAQIEELANRCEAAYTKMKDAFEDHLWCRERQSYARTLNVHPRGGFERDNTLDASTLYAMLAFGVFQPGEPGVTDTIRSVEQRLWCRTPIGGMARYENDPYYRQSHDIENVPGSPWFICTLWAALGRIFLGQDLDALSRAKNILQWACDRARPSGVLAEQVHPYTGAAMSVSPLTWSHATFVETVLAYEKKYQEISQDRGPH